jgi:hypothetical protein
VPASLSRVQSHVPSLSSKQRGRHGRAFPRPSTSCLFPHNEDVDPGVPGMTIFVERERTHLTA